MNKHKCGYDDTKIETRKDGSQYSSTHCVIEIIGNKLNIELDVMDVDCDNGDSIPISFCPFCGEKLGVE